MVNYNVDVAVIGGGPAGLAAAVSARDNGAKYVVVIDRNDWLGGILPQCIHDGFGVEETGSSMTGPEYANMYIRGVRKKGISVMKETMVLSFDKNLEITAVNKSDLHKIKAKSIVLAMGCREKTRWNIMIPGDRPSGIYTAGVAQAFINLYNIIPGKDVLILGSGDVGLIIARRLKFEGANVHGVVEILPYASGLPRNVVQCLDDYDIPLYLKYTVTKIEGKDRLESLTIARVDDNFNVISGTEKKIRCDTLLLSIGLIPENELSKKVDIKLDDSTGGPIVDQDYETYLSGVYACGNCLQVYDTVDMLSIGAKHAGKYAARNVLKEKGKPKKVLKVKPGKGVNYIVPQMITKKGSVNFTFRVKKPGQSKTVSFYQKDNEIYKKKLRYVNPANMISLDVNISKSLIESQGDLEVVLDG